MHNFENNNTLLLGEFKFKCSIGKNGSTANRKLIKNSKVFILWVLYFTKRQVQKS